MLVSEPNIYSIHYTVLYINRSRTYTVASAAFVTGSDIVLCGGGDGMDTMLVEI